MGGLGVHEEAGQGLRKSGAGRRGAGGGGISSVERTYPAAGPKTKKKGRTHCGNTGKEGLQRDGADDRASFRSSKIDNIYCEDREKSMHVSFRQLQLFLAVAELRSITAAARACHVTQPTVSMQLKELADSVGLPLYEVVGKRLDLTAAGEALAVSARAMVEEWANFEQRIDAMQGLARGRLRVGVVSTAKYFVPRILGGFCTRYPEIDVILDVQNRDGVVTALRDNRHDLYIMSRPPADIEIVQQPFLSNPLVLIAAEGHPLAGRRGIALAELAGERFILRERGSGTRLACDEYFAACGFVPSVRLELGSNVAIKQSVAGGMGLSVISSHTLGAHLEDEQLTVLDVEGFPIHSNWSILYPRGKRLSPIAGEFLAYLRDSAEALRQRQGSAA